MSTYAQVDSLPVSIDSSFVFTDSIDFPLDVSTFKSVNNEISNATLLDSFFQKLAALEQHKNQKYA